MLSFHRADHRLCQLNKLRIATSSLSRSVSTRSAINRGLRTGGPTYKRDLERTARSPQWESRGSRREAPSSSKFGADRPSRTFDRNSRDASSSRNFGANVDRPRRNFERSGRDGPSSGRSSTDRPARAFDGSRRDAPTSGRFGADRPPRVSDGIRRDAPSSGSFGNDRPSRGDIMQGSLLDTLSNRAPFEIPERASLFDGSGDPKRAGSYGNRDGATNDRDRGERRAPAGRISSDDRRDPVRSRIRDSYGEDETPFLGKVQESFAGRSERTYKDPFDKADRFDKGDRFNKADRFDKGGRFDKADRFDKRDRFEKRDRFDKRDAPPRNYDRGSGYAQGLGMPGRGPKEINENLHGTDSYPRERRTGYADRAPREEYTDNKKTYSERGGHNQEDFDDGVPISIPYTTAASRFLYGANVVTAALMAQRRKLHRLYLCQNAQGDEGSPSASNPKRAANRKKQFYELGELARKANVKVDSNADVRLLNKLSENRPHNGVVLEASPAPTPPLLHLGLFDPISSQVPLTLAEQSIEEIAANGTPESLKIPQKSWRKPFVVMLDGITDPGNVGNIIRTCHFFGVDAVVVATNTCANVASPVLVKASSGAYESIPIFLLPQPSNFLYDSARNGWKIYGAMPPNAAAAPRDGGRAKNAVTSNDLVTASPLLDDACILVIGSEGEGLRANLQNRCSNFVSIERDMIEDDAAVPVGVDSINVATATGILTQAFLSKPQGATDRVIPHFTDNFLFTPGDDSRHDLDPESVLYEQKPVDDTIHPVLEESGEAPAVEEEVVDGETKDVAR